MKLLPVIRTSSAVPREFLGLVVCLQELLESCCCGTKIGIIVFRRRLRNLVVRSQIFGALCMSTIHCRWCRCEAGKSMSYGREGGGLDGGKIREAECGFD